MFRFRKQGNQAKRTMPAAPSGSFQWRKSYNWIFLLFPLTLGSVYLHQSEQLLPIRKIQLSGSFEYLNQDQVESTLRQTIGQGFFSLDIHQLQQSLHAESWTETVSIRRIWPDKLRVVISEKRPVARWDEQNLLSDSAKVYRADTRGFSHLPVVFATSHEPAWVLTQYYRLASRLSSVDERLIALHVDRRGAFHVELINDLQIKLGRGNIDHKIDRLVSIYTDQILPRREQIRRLDLRYSNGFAVAWKKEALQVNDKASIWSNSNV